MNLGKRTGLALLAAFLTLPVLAEELRAIARPEDAGFASDRLERVTRTFQGYVDQDQLPGAVVLIARAGKVAYLRAFAWRDREQASPMTTDAIFRIASMTKPIVSVAAMILVEEGRLDLAAPVARYLPEFKDLSVRAGRVDPATGKTETVMEPQRRPMTVQDLLRHTAGLVYGPPLGDGPVSLAYRDAGVSTRDETLAEMVTKLSRLPLAHQPGEVWEYSVATDVLGRVVEVVSGMELDRFVTGRVTKPLGMDSTGFYVAETERDRVTQPRVEEGTGRRPPMFDPVQKPKRLSGGGGAVSTAGDYLRFCEMLLNGGERGETRLLAPSTVALMTANALRPGIGYSARTPRAGDLAPMPEMGQGFGLGFAVRTEVGRNPLPGSVGSFYWTGAYGTTFYIDPREKLIIIMMVQAPMSSGETYRRAIRSLTYQALTHPK